MTENGHGPRQRRASRSVVAASAAQEASDLGLRLWQDRERFEVLQKNGTAHDFVSEADTEMERLLREQIRLTYPDDTIVGEELGGVTTDSFWCLDPIDGTSNFLRGSPLWGISVAFVKDDKTEIAVVALPALGIVVSADRDGPLMMNGQPHPANRDSEIQLVAVGDNPVWAPGALAKLEGALRESGWAVASYRCATVGLAFAALGYVDGYVEKWTNLWDIAAGRLICERAGLNVRTGQDAADMAANWWVQAYSPGLELTINGVWDEI